MIIYHINIYEGIFPQNFSPFVEIIIYIIKQCGIMSIF